MNDSEPPLERSESTPPPGTSPDLPLGFSEAPTSDPAEPSGGAVSSPEDTEHSNSPPRTEETAAPPPAAPPIPAPLTALIAVLAVTVGFIEAWSFWHRPAVERLYYPLETVLRMVERGMEFREVADRAGPLAKALLWLGGDRPERYAKELPEMYREVLRAPAGGAVTEETKQWLQAHLVVLLGELGQTNQCRAELENLLKRSNDTNFAAAVRRVYLLDNSGNINPEFSPATDSLRAGWTRDRFEARLAQADERLDHARLGETRILDRRRTWYDRTMIGLTFELALVVTAFALLFHAWRRGGIDWRRGPDPSFVPWPVSDGLAIFCGAFLLGRALVYLPSLGLGPMPTLFGIHCYLLLPAVAAVVLVILCLLRPRALRFGQQFGFNFSRPALNVLLGGACLITGFDIAGYQVADRTCDAFGIQGHWTEGLDENLLYGLRFERMAVLMNMTLFGPFYEELLFRGVLFATLRKRMGLLASAAISSIAFALTHQYSIPGLLGVFCFGFVCALVYERTRNLGVCVAGHLLTNLTISLFDIATLG